MMSLRLQESKIVRSLYTVLAARPILCVVVTLSLWFIPTSAVADTAGSTADATTTQLTAKTPAPGADHEHAVVFSGGQADTANAGYAGATLALPNSYIGRGFAIRLDGFTGNYKYSSSIGAVAAGFSGVEFDGVYQVSSQSSWTNFAVGVRDVNTQLAPFDVSNRRHGQISEIATSIDGGTVARALRADYDASYGARLDDYAARVSLTHTVSPLARLGAEVSFEGDPTYALRRVGPYVGLRLDGRSELQLSSGVSQQSGRSVSGFFRAGVYRSF